MLIANPKDRFLASKPNQSNQRLKRNSIFIHCRPTNINCHLLSPNSCADAEPVGGGGMGSGPYAEHVANYFAIYFHLGPNYLGPSLLGPRFS